MQEEEEEKDDYHGVVLREAVNEFTHFLAFTTTPPILQDFSRILM